MTEPTSGPLGNVMTIDHERITSHLDRVVRGGVEKTLKALLDALNAVRHDETPVPATCATCGPKRARCG
jgi:hypothetical protein